MSAIPSFVTHYYEQDSGPFRNICDLPESDWASLIEAEKGAPTEFNRFALGVDFLRMRCRADDWLCQLYAERFGDTARRPAYAVLGEFERTTGMYRNALKLEFDLDLFEEHEVTFIYEDHFHLNWVLGQDEAPEWFELRSYHGRIFTRNELRAAFADFGWNRYLDRARGKGAWVSAYVEAHIWVDYETLNQRSQSALNRR